MNSNKNTQQRPPSNDKKSMTEQQIGQKFNKATKQNKSKTNQQIINQINSNEQYFDNILIRQVLETYSKKEQLEATASLYEVWSYFQYVQQNINTIQNYYLGVNQEDKDTKQQADYYQKNKANIQKFIRDQNILYEKTIQQNLANINEQQASIKASSIIQLLKTLFSQQDQQSTNKHIAIYKDGKDYFKSQSFQSDTHQIIKNFAITNKDINKEVFTMDNFYVQEDEMLDFLTYWLKDPINNQSLKVIYARTELKLKQLKEKCQFNYQNSLLEQQPQNQFIDEDKMKEFEDKQKLRTKSKVSKLNGYKLSSLLVQKDHTQNGLSRNNSTRKSKQQQLKISLPELFIFACKRRTKIHKNTTFDQIQQQSKHMDLEKFINLCGYLELYSILSRQYLIDMFKLYAINRLHLDLKKFQELVNKLTQQNKEVIDKFLNKQKCLFLKKKKFNIKNKESIGSNPSLNKGSNGASSEYVYHLRPVNGMDIQTIQQQLKQRKQEKLEIRKQKYDYAMKKKQGYFHKFTKDGLLKRRSDKSGISNSNSTLADKSKIFEFAQKPQKKDQFNPQSLISNLHDQQDKLWDQYQSKIWKKDQTRSKFGLGIEAHEKRDIENRNNDSILDQALSRRLQKGNKVLKKIASSNLKYYI